MLSRCSLSLVGAALLAAPLTAQLTHHGSLTTWAHTGGSPSWTDNVTLPTTLPKSEFKTVDQLNSTTLLSYTGRVTQLKPGWYVATARIMKFKDEKGAADLSIEAIGGNGLTKRMLPAAHSIGPKDKKTGKYTRVGKWIWTPGVTFQVKASAPSVILRITNTDTKVTKQNYYFDSFRVGRIPEGKALLYESLTLSTFRSTWGSPYHTRMNPATTSAFGVDNKLNYVWWLWFARFGEAQKIVLQPGTYTFNFRMHTPLLSNLGDLKYAVRVGTSKAVTRTWAAADQPVSQWTLTPNFSFVVTAKDTEVGFSMGNTSSAQKSNYEYDAFILRKGAYEPSGLPCKSSLGSVILDGNIPQLGEPWSASVRNCPTAAIFMFGVQSTKIDLSKAGMNGCSLYTMPLISIAAVATKNVASLTIPIGIQKTLIGAQWINQALVLDTKANKVGLVTSNAMKALITN